jgi:predicted nuclease of predicted toxin-antitoxin system
LLDVNVGTTIALALSDAGHDLQRVGFLTPRAADDDILAKAVADQRILITHDSDFTDLIFDRGAESPPAVIYIRAGDAEAIIAERILALVREDDLIGNIFVIGARVTRRRPLPN